MQYQPAKTSAAQRRGFSIVELLIALAITAVLLTATMAAIDASFRAYANAAEEASTHAATRMVSQRLTTMLRSSTAHGPLEPGTGATLDGVTITASFIELIDHNGDFVRVEYRPDERQLWYIRDRLDGSPLQEQPIIDDVTEAVFYLVRRRNDRGVWVMDRGTLDLTVQPPQDNTLSIENGQVAPIRVISSTMPRRVE